MKNHKEQNSIPTSKIGRASKFIGTGVKIGGNYLKHYAQKLLDENITRDELHANNADDIYNTLSQLKGSALKVAQMLSMDQGILPKAYADKFSMSQYNAPPLSGPLVVNTFRKTLGKTPQELFDTFDMHASNAASIGQVHQASLKGQKLAIKIQYPGVADSIQSDLKLVKPFALKLIGLKEQNLDTYFNEVENKLLEETNYELEINRSIELSKRCAHLKHIKFPKYYPNLSSNKIITMEWLDGLHLKEYLKTNPSQAQRNQVAQAIWDFYEFQMHDVKMIHADPHPGNFLFLKNDVVGIFDFGCVKEVPTDFYNNYFKLIDKKIIQNNTERNEVFMALEMIHESDSKADKAFFTDLFQQMIDLLAVPFMSETFDFANQNYFIEIYAYAEKLAAMPEIKNSKLPRGSKHSLYINRTYFGLYSLLNELKANINTKSNYLKL